VHTLVQKCPAASALTVCLVLVVFIVGVVLAVHHGAPWLGWLLIIPSVLVALVWAGRGAGRLRRAAGRAIRRLTKRR
jgi:hypothetical protein